MIKGDNGVTVREVYQLIDKKMDVVNSSIGRLESKFDALESGRLSAVERDVANINGRLIVISVLPSIAINAFIFILNQLLK